jgi:type IV secretion system protein TrbB
MESTRKRHLENLEISMTPLLEFIKDETVTDIYINIDGKIWIKKFAVGRMFTGKSLDPDGVRRIINFTAALLGDNVFEKNPSLQGIIPNLEARIQAFIEPWVPSPSIIIRKLNRKVIPLQDWLREKRITLPQFNAIREAISDRLNILISGGMGSGKTTMLNTLINEITVAYPRHRLFIVEDTGELRCTAEDYISLCVLPHETIEAIRRALRSDSDRIIFGELRYGNVCAEYLKSLNTGCQGGLSTLHSDSAESVISRLRSLINETDLRHEADTLIKESVHVCMFMKDKGNGPIVESIINYKENSVFEYRCEDTMKVKGEDYEKKMFHHLAAANSGV